VLVLSLLVRFWKNIVIILSTVKREFFFFSDSLSDIYLLKADLDSRNVSQCIIKDCSTKSICYVWSDN